MTPGTAYHIVEYNCSHVVADYYKSRFNVTLPAGHPDNWGMRFMLFMRRRFSRIEKQEQDCLIVVKQRNGRLHVGVWDSGMMLHGHNDGQVIRSPLALITGELSFWRYHGDN